MRVSTVVRHKYFNGAASAEDTDRYRGIITNNFREVGMVAFGQIGFVANNEPKSETDYNWKTIDNLVDFSKKNNLQLHYNAVINNKNSFPEWYKSLTPKKKNDFLQNHIKTVVKRYKNDFYLFKLVNESVRDNEEDFLGTNESRVGLIAKMFKWAKEESPDSLFMINDFGNFFDEEIRQKYIKLINEVKDVGGPIDVVGLQSHMWPFQLPPNKNIRETLSQIHRDVKLPIHITEFDLSYDNSIHGGNKIDPQKAFIDRRGVKYNNWFDYQAYAYSHFFDICNKTSYIEGFTFWGFCDEDVAWERPGIGIFDKDFNPKPAYKFLRGKF